MLTVHCPLITRLVLRDCPWADQSSLNYFSQHNSTIRRPGLQMEDVLLHMGRGLRTNLKARTKAKYRGKDQLYNDMKKRKGRFKPRFKNLIELDLTSCHCVTDDDINTVTGVFKHLQVFGLGSIASITDNAMKSIAIDLKQLHTLDIRCDSYYSNSWENLFCLNIGSLPEQCAHQCLTSLFYNSSGAYHNSSKI